MRLPVRDHQTTIGRCNAGSETVKLAHLTSQACGAAGKPVAGRFGERPAAPGVAHVRESLLEVVPCDDSGSATHDGSRRVGRWSMERREHPGDLSALR